MMTRYKLSFVSNTVARRAAWQLRQLRSVRLGSCVLVEAPENSDASYNSAICAVLVKYGGYIADELTPYDVRALASVKR
jgi:hypothetical protein